MKKTLPVGQAPIICALHHAYPLSILAQSSAYLPWFYSHFIQVEYPKALIPKGEKKRFNFYRHPLYRVSFFSPGIQIQNLHTKIVQRSFKNISDFVTQCINDSYYVQLDIDEFYLPNKAFYQQRHYTRQILNFGYDQEKKQVKILGFDYRGNFTKDRVRFCELDRAFQAASPIFSERHYRIFLFEHLPQTHYEFDITLVLEQLCDYVFSYNTAERYRIFQTPTYRAYAIEPEPVEHAYGMQTYDYLKIYLKALGCTGMRVGRVTFLTLWEHKKCMYDRLLYMEQQRYLEPEQGFSSAYLDVEKKSNMLKLMFFKYTLTGDCDLIEKMIRLIDKIAEEEYSILYGLIAVIQKKVKLV